MYNSCTEKVKFWLQKVIVITTFRGFPVLTVRGIGSSDRPGT